MQAPLLWEKSARPLLIASFNAHPTTNVYIHPSVWWAVRQSCSQSVRQSCNENVRQGSKAQYVMKQHSGGDAPYKFVYLDDEGKEINKTHQNQANRPGSTQISTL